MNRVIGCLMSFILVAGFSLFHAAGGMVSVSDGNVLTF